jgi:photosystem II stability/assembly factor-like uncharacterized protein
MITFPELETRLRECAELHEREVPAVPDLNRRILARAAVTARGERARPTLKRDLVLSALVAAGIVGLAIVITVGVRSHFIQPTVPAKQSPTPSAPAAPGSVVLIGNSQFISAQVGWLNEFRTTPAGPSVVYKTTDGGSHWQQQLRWDGPSAQQMLFEGDDGLVVGQGGVPLFRTTDGGGHWQRMSLPPQAVQGEAAGPIYFRNPRQGWLLAYLSETYSDALCSPGGCPLLGVFHTADGGQSWTQAAKLKPMQAFPGAHLQGQLRFWDALNGWLIDDSGSPALHLVYTTHDGGKSWKGVSLQSPQLGGNQSAIISEPPHFFTSDEGLLVVQTTPVCQAGTCPSPQSAPMSYLYRTNDGGDHWSGPSALPTIGSFGFNSVFFLDAARYWMVGASTVATSVDGGQHWSIHRDVVPASLFLSQPEFLSVTVGWVIATSPKQLGGVPQMALYKTRDGGAHWVAVPTPAPDLTR